MFPPTSPAKVDQKWAAQTAEDVTSALGYNFNEAVSLLDSNCAKNCGKFIITHFLTSGSQAEYKQLYDKIKDKK